MMLAVELRRFFTRRLGLVVSIATVAVMALVLIISLANSHKPDAQEIEYAQGEAQRARIDAQVFYDECIAMTDEPQFVDGEPNTYSGEDCDRYNPELVDTADYLYGVVTFTQDAPGLMYAFGALVALAGLITAASFVGADWPSGGMTNQLLWKPRRMEVFFSKLGASLITVITGAVGVTALFLLLLWLLTAIGGYVGDVTGAWVGNFVEQCLQVALLPVVLTTVGFALAMLGRRTAAALGALVGYVVVFEFGLRALGELLPGLYFIEAGLLSSYAVAWLTGSYEIVDYSGAYMRGDYLEPERIVIDQWTGFGVLLGFAVVLVGVAALVFRRRDVANN